MTSLYDIIDKQQPHRKALDKQIKEAIPFVQWVGGKRQLIEKYKTLLPKNYENYYEPFAGGASIFYYMYSLYGESKKYFLSDLNKELVISYEQIKLNPTRVKEIYNDLYERHTKKFYYDIRNIDRTSPSPRKYEKSFDILDTLPEEEIAARFLYLNMTCFNAIYRVNGSGLFNVPIGTSLKKDFSVGNKFDLCSEVLKNVTIEHQSYLEVENLVQTKDFVYFDPPYAPLTATSNFTSYTKEGFDVKDQKELKELCDRLDSKGVCFAVSNSNCELITDLYKDYNKHVFVVNRNLNSKKDKRKESAEEVLITNY